MGVDWGSGDAVQTFEFARRAQVVFLVDDVDEAEGRDEDEEDGRCGGDDAQGEECAACVDEELEGALETLIGIAWMVGIHLPC